MLRYIAKRLFFAVVSVWAIATVTFFMALLAPGDPAEMKYEHSSEAAIQVYRHSLGLDLPPATRYVHYMDRLVHGDLGTSYSNDQPISAFIGSRFPVTALLAFTSLIIALTTGTSVGILAALKRDTWIDRTLMTLLLLGISIPNFVLAPLLILFFALQLHVLPIIWDGTPASIVMPAIVLAARPTALIGRMVKSSMIETLHQDYIRTARAKGLSPGRIVFVHALKNAFLPALTAAGTSFGYMLSGSFVVESIFSIPGVGLASFLSFTQRDYPMIQGVTILLATIFVLTNLVIDLLYAALDPRARQIDAPATGAST